ncbi:MAG: ATP-binding protein [Clostridia bacterium]|nr:ATP-binding protein [Clostridia bacterium]
MDENNREIIDLEDKLNSYPKGTVVTKTIQGKKRSYLQWRENGKTKSKYLKDSEIDDIKVLVAQRQSIEKRLKQIKKAAGNIDGKSFGINSVFKTNVVIGNRLSATIDSVKKYKKRYCFKALNQFIGGDFNGKICILYGLRRTGKTTLVFQMIGELPIEKCAYIKVRSTDNMSMLTRDFDELFNGGYKYIFIDEITLMEDFIGTAAVLSDIYSQMGLKIVVSGTDSLGFVFADRDELYDRNVMIHTSFISYGEYSYLLDIHSVDTYIEYGGTLKIENMDFDDPDSVFDEVSFRDDESTRKYIDTAISRNIQHSLKNNRSLRYLHHLNDLYDAGELTNVINRIIENMNHAFLVSVVTEKFKSHDLGSVKELLLHDIPLKRSHVLYDINAEEVLKTLKKIIEVKENDETTVKVTANHVEQVKSYLFMLDLIVDCPTVYDDMKEEERIIFTQPGMRYAITKALVYSLMKDSYFLSVSEQDRNYIINKILDDVRGRMLEDIVTLEVNKKSGRYKKAFKFKLSGGGEIDMVVADELNGRCELFEIKHSKKAVAEQARFLKDDKMCGEVEKRFGGIIGKTVLYRGEDTEVDGIKFLNVEKFLCDL